jgi:hypothetical protein
LWNTTSVVCAHALLVIDIASGFSGCAIIRWTGTLYPLAGNIRNAQGYWLARSTNKICRLGCADVGQSSVTGHDAGLLGLDMPVDRHAATAVTHMATARIPPTVILLYMFSS